MEFGIAIEDKHKNEFYASVYIRLLPAPICVVQFIDPNLDAEYGPLQFPVRNGELVVNNYPESSIPNIGDLIANAIKTYLAESELSIV
jgi:hypothetical protein